MYFVSYQRRADTTREQESEILALMDRAASDLFEVIEACERLKISAVCYDRHGAVRAYVQADGSYQQV